MEEVISVADLQRRAREYVDRAASSSEPIIVESDGHPRAALIGLDAYARLSRTQGRSIGGADFLLGIAGLGASGQADVSERAEEILEAEIDAQEGWSAGSGSSD
jgi:prevent-host-death family protein